MASDEDAVADGADLTRAGTPATELVTFTDVAEQVGLDFRHSAYRWKAGGDPFAMMGGGLCWIDYDRDGWLDLFVVDTWSDGEWGRWRREGALPTSRLYRNERGRFVDVSDDTGTALELRGSGCVAADLDLDGFDDLYVTTERANVLLWNTGGDRFEPDDGTAGVDAYGWHAGAAVGDVDGDGWPDLFVAGYADTGQVITGTAEGFPRTFAAEPDLLFLSTGASAGERPRFADVAAAVGIERSQVDYGLGAVFSDVDFDGDLDLHVANDTDPNRLYLNRTDPGTELGFVFVDVGAAAGVDDTNAGMGIASGDYDGDSYPDLIVTNLAGQGHAAFRHASGTAAPSYRAAVRDMGIPELGQGHTGWGTAWVDIDLDTDLDLVVAQGAIPVNDLVGDREQLQVFANLGAQGEIGRFAEVTATIGLTASGSYLARGLAAADYDNDGDVDLAVGTIGGALGLLRNSGAGGHWLTVAASPATPGTTITAALDAGTVMHREILAGSSYLSSEDPRAHFGLGSADRVRSITVRWPDGTETVRTDVGADRIVEVSPD